MKRKDMVIIAAVAIVLIGIAVFDPVSETRSGPDMFGAPEIVVQESMLGRILPVEVQDWLAGNVDFNVGNDFYLTCVPLPGREDKRLKEIMAKYDLLTEGEEHDDEIDVGQLTWVVSVDGSPYMLMMLVDPGNPGLFRLVKIGASWGDQWKWTLRDMEFARQFRSQRLYDDLAELVKTLPETGPFYEWNDVDIARTLLQKEGIGNAGGMPRDEERNPRGDCGKGGGGGWLDS